MNDEMIRTIFISDMKDFTIDTQQHGVDYVIDKVMRMRKVVISILEEHGGTVFKVDADNIYALFEEPHSAVTASLRTRRDLPDDIQICIGIGHGTIKCCNEDNDYYGLEVNLASKLGEDTAQAREILITEAAYNLLHESAKSQFSGPRILKIKEFEYMYYAFADE